MSITPIDIQQHRFKTRPLGYEKTGVDHFLELISDELERLTRLNQGLKEELARAKSTMDEMRGREATLKQTLMTAQQMSEDMKNNARREGEILIAEAHMRAERIVRDAEDRRIQLVAEIQEVKRQKITFEAGLRALVESHMRLLDLDVLPFAGREFGELEGGGSFPLKGGSALGEDDKLELEGF